MEKWKRVKGKARELAAMGKIDSAQLEQGPGTVAAASLRLSTKEAT